MSSNTNNKQNANQQSSDTKNTSNKQASKQDKFDVKEVKLKSYSKVIMFYPLFIYSVIALLIQHLGEGTIIPIDRI
ncbi:MAG: hypothetical protein GF364_06055 [Candidatus Lokiarchaeota archaeon]|nr:hypothetical protein [Candidatus Lokiarchaeota archaeon]